MRATKSPDKRVEHKHGDTDLSGDAPRCPLSESTSAGRSDAGGGTVSLAVPREKPVERLKPNSGVTDSSSEAPRDRLSESASVGLSVAGRGRVSPLENKEESKVADVLPKQSSSGHVPIDLVPLQSEEKLSAHDGQSADIPAIKSSHSQPSLICPPASSVKDKINHQAHEQNSDDLENGGGVELDRKSGASIDAKDGADLKDEDGAGLEGKDGVDPKDVDAGDNANAAPQDPGEDKLPNDRRRRCRKLRT